MKLEIKEAGGVYKKSVLRMDNDYSLCAIDKEDYGIFEEIVMRSNLHEELIEGLKEIAKGTGAYNKDQLIHAGNTIENMKGIASQLIQKATITY